MTQKYLGLRAGLPERAADIRVAQYEAGTRTPKSNIVDALANALGVSPEALTVPNIDTEIGLMHTLFALEDMYGLTIDKKDGEYIIRIDTLKCRESNYLLERLPEWYKQYEKYRNGEITKEEYDNWRYNFALPSDKDLFNELKKI